MSEFFVVKTPQGFVPATDDDMEYASNYRTGDVIRIRAQKPRNGQHHKKGILLLKAAFDYWEPETSYLTAGEKSMADAISNRLESLSNNSGAIASQIDEVVKQIEDSRATRIGEPAKCFEAFRKQLTIRAGYYELVTTPTGIEKRAKSISFEKMSQEEFGKLYKDLLSVCWEVVLSKHFETEEEAENAINQMLDFI